MKRLLTGCKSLDTLLGNGIESGIITKIFGEAGTGKTNVCLQAARECANRNQRVVYIDSEGVSIERLRQICNQKYDYEKILKKILFKHPLTLEDQEKSISEAVKLQDVPLLIIDTINLLYRIEMEHDKQGSIRCFIRQMTNLQISARKNDLFILVTEQVYTDKNGRIQPFTNRDTEHMVKTVVRFDKKDVGKRQATIVKHRYQPEGKNIIFFLTEHGLE